MFITFNLFLHLVLEKIDVFDRTTPPSGVNKSYSWTRKLSKYEQTFSTETCLKHWIYYIQFTD